MDSSKMLPKAAMMGNIRPDMMWHGTQNPPQSHSAVSVVTTVYPGVPTFTGSSQVFNTSAPHPNSSGVFGGPTGVVASPAATYVVQPGQISKSSSTSSNYGPDSTAYLSPDIHHHQGYVQHGGPMGDYAMSTPRHAVAVNAAAQATAAAVATATATATAVALDQSQFQNYPQPVHYGNQAYQQSMAYVQPSQHQQEIYQQDSLMMAQQRLSAPSPYMTAPGTIRASRPIQGSMPRYAVSGPAVRGMVPTATQDGFRHQQYPNSGQTLVGVGVPMVNPISHRGMIPQQPYGPPQMNNMAPLSSYQRYPRAELRRALYQGGAAANPGPSMPGYGQQMMAPAGMQNNYRHHTNGVIPAYQQNPRGSNVGFCGPASSLPNNPTPPLTPAATTAMPVGGPVEYGVGNGNSSSQADDAESRLTLPVKNGSILAPFRLEHNSPVSQHMFVLDDATHQLLCTNNSYDLQLKCFHAEDKIMANNWPHNANIQICVNGAPVVVKSVERPLYIKSFCQKNQNTLQVAVQQCCCSHLFCLSVVNRPTVDSVVRQLVHSRSLPTEHCIEKLRAFFQSGEANLIKENAVADVNPEIEQTSVNLSLKCPITMQRIKLPARGQDCKHAQCFDLWTYCELNKDRSNWQCPICKRPAPIDLLEIDQYVLSILTNLNNVDADEVSLDSSAAWKVIMRQNNENASDRQVKEEDTDVPCSNAKRFKSESSFNPSSWGQQSSSTTQFQSPVYNRSDSVLSPYYQNNTSPNGPASFNASTVGTMPMRQMAPPTTKSGPASVPQNFINPLSAGAVRGETNGSNFGVQRPTFGSNNDLTGQQMKNPSSGFLETAETYSQNFSSGSNVLDFPDFTFDASDLLDSGDMAQRGGSLFNDPEELMKYLADPGDYGSLDSSTTDQTRQSTSQNQSSLQHTSKYPTNSSGAGNDQSSINQSSSQTPSASQSSSEFASMDEILSLLYK